MADRVIANADKTCVLVHALAWVAAMATWGLKWLQEGPAPSGPLYNAAKDFISRLDVFAHHTVHAWSMTVSTTASTWFSADLGAWYTISFALLIFLAGTLQWFLLGRLVQWVAARKGRVAALSILGMYGAWVAGALFLWVAA